MAPTKHAPSTTTLELHKDSSAHMIRVESDHLHGEAHVDRFINGRVTIPYLPNIAVQIIVISAKICHRPWLRTDPVSTSLIYEQHREVHGQDCGQLGEQLPGAQV